MSVKQWYSPWAFFLCLFCHSCEAQENGAAVLQAATGSPIDVGCNPGNITTGDLDKDGKIDFVVSCGMDKRLTIFKGKGTGEFAKLGQPIVLPYGPNEIVIGDMNRDGNNDLVIANHDSYEVLILPGDGRGNFSVSSKISVPMKSGGQPHTHGLGIGDFNSDGYTDIVTANNQDNDISVVLNNKNGGFNSAPGSPYPVAASPYPLTVGDVNGDGKMDVVSSSTNPRGKTASLLLGDGRGNFNRIDVPIRTPSCWFSAIGDLNKDGRPDLVLTHSERPELSVLLGSENNQFKEVGSSPYNMGSYAWHVAIADVNSDGHADILAAANTGVRVYLGDGQGNFRTAPGSPYLTGKGSWHLAIADVNGDGKPDVLTSNLESGNVAVLLGR